MKKRGSSLKFLLVAIIFGALAGGITSYVIENSVDSQDELIKEFYAVEAAAHVSPHHIRKGMAKGDDSFILVDLRSEEE